MKNFLVFIGIMSLAFIVVGCNEDPVSSSSVDTSTSISESSSSEVETLERVVSGKVTSDGVEIEGATVRIRNTEYSVTTNANGNYSITIAEADAEMVEFRILASKEGFSQASIDVVEGSFVDGEYTLDITLNSATIVLRGVVSSDAGVIEGAKVAIKNTAYETLTNADGAYTFTLDRPLEIELVVSFEFYKTENLTLSNFNTGSSFTQNITLFENTIDVTGTVSHFYTGSIEGVSVTIRGTEYITTTTADGSFVFENVTLEDDNYIVDLAKPGYVAASYQGEEVNDEMEMMLDYASLGKFAPNAGDFEAFVTKSSEGFYFRFVSPEEFRFDNGKEEKIQLYIDVNETAQNRAGDSVVEFAMTSNNGVIVVVSYATNPITFLNNILWGDEVNYVHNYQDGTTTLSLFIKYSIFNDYAGPSFAIDAESIVGLSFGQFSFFEDVSTPWNPWERPDMLGVDKKAVVNAECPADYVRLLPDNTIYEAATNEAYPIVERTIEGVVSSAGGVVSGLTVTIPALGLETITNADGRYSLVIPSTYFGVSTFDVQYQLLGFLTKTEVVVRDDFTNNKIIKDVLIVEGYDQAKVTGNIITFFNQNEGFKVEIKDPDYEVVTGLDGRFTLLGIEVDSLPFTLVISKTGYMTKEVVIDSLSTVLNDLELIKDYQLIGQVGQDQFDTYVTRTLDSFLFKYVSTSTFRNDNGEELMHQYITIKDNTFDIRFVPGGWTGVWNTNANNWALWTPQIHNPVIIVKDGITTLTHQIEYAYFETVDGTYTIGAGDSVYFDVVEESHFYHFGDVDGEYTITLEDVQFGGAYYAIVKPAITFVGLTNAGAKVKDFRIIGNVPEAVLLSGKISSYDNQTENIILTIKGEEITVTTDAYGRFTFAEIDVVFPLTLVITKDGYISKEVVVNSIGDYVEVELIKEATHIGVTGHDRFDVYVTRTSDRFLFKYVGPEMLRVDGGEEIIHQYLIYNGNLLDVRFNSAGWTGVFNVTTNQWLPWTPEVANPVVSVDGGITTITQTVKYSYFNGLGSAFLIDTVDVGFTVEETSPFYHEGDSYTITNEDLTTGFLKDEIGYVEGEYSVTMADVQVGGAFYNLTKPITTMQLDDIHGTPINIDYPFVLNGVGA